MVIIEEFDWTSSRADRGILIASPMVQETACVQELWVNGHLILASGIGWGFQARACFSCTYHEPLVNLT